MLINNEEPLYFKDGNIIWFKNEDRIDGEFFYHSFNGSFIQNFIKESAGIGTVGTYTIESGKKTPILLPTQKDEQQKIGTFFSQLDTLITLHQRKCDKYKSIKSRIDQKVFFHEITNTLRRNVRMSIGDTERTTQNRVIDFFKNRNILDYKYIGNLKDTANKNIREDRLVRTCALAVTVKG